MPTLLEGRGGEPLPGNKLVGHADDVPESSVGDAALRTATADGELILGAA